MCLFFNGELFASTLHLRKKIFVGFPSRTNAANPPDRPQEEPELGPTFRTATINHLSGSVTVDLEIFEVPLRSLYTDIAAPHSMIMPMNWK